MKPDGCKNIALPEERVEVAGPGRLGIDEFKPVLVEFDGRIPADFEYWKPTFRSDATVEPRLALPASTALTAEIFLASMVTDGARLASPFPEFPDWLSPPGVFSGVQAKSSARVATANRHFFIQANISV